MLSSAPAYRAKGAQAAANRYEGFVLQQLFQF
jgi:hypothetical protein